MVVPRRLIRSTMVSGLIMLLTLTAVVTNLGCITVSITGSDNMVTRTEEFRDFTAVDAGSGFQVTITRSDQYGVMITANDNVIDRVTVSRRGGKLYVDLKVGNYDSVQLKANITMPELREVKLSGGSRCVAKVFNSTGRFVLKLGGGSTAEITGSAGDLSIDASLGSQLFLSKFQVNNADVTLSGGSRATINLDGTLDADLSGGSHLYYIGEPTMGDTRTEGGSSISKK